MSTWSSAGVPAARPTTMGSVLLVYVVGTDGDWMNIPPPSPPSVPPSGPAQSSVLALQTDPLAQPFVRQDSGFGLVRQAAAEAPSSAARKRPFPTLISTYSLSLSRVIGPTTRRPASSPSHRAGVAYDASCVRRSPQLAWCSRRPLLQREPEASPEPSTALGAEGPSVWGAAAGSRAGRPLGAGKMQDGLAALAVGEERRTTAHSPQEARHLREPPFDGDASRSPSRRPTSRLSDVRQSLRSWLHETRQGLPLRQIARPSRGSRPSCRGLETEQPPRAGWVDPEAWSASRDQDSAIATSDRPPAWPLHCGSARARWAPRRRPPCPRPGLAFSSSPPESPRCIAAAIRGALASADRTSSTSRGRRGSRMGTRPARRRRPIRTWPRVKDAFLSRWPSRALPGSPGAWCEAWGTPPARSRATEGGRRGLGREGPS